MHRTQPHFHTSSQLKMKDVGNAEKLVYANWANEPRFHRSFTVSNMIQHMNSCRWHQLMRAHHSLPRDKVATIEQSKLEQICQRQRRGSISAPLSQRMTKEKRQQTGKKKHVNAPYENVLNNNQLHQGHKFIDASTCCIVVMATGLTSWPLLACLYKMTLILISVSTFNVALNAHRQP